MCECVRLICRNSKECNLENQAVVHMFACLKYIHIVSFTSFALVLVTGIVVCSNGKVAAILGKLLDCLALVCLIIRGPETTLVD